MAFPLFKICLLLFLTVFLIQQSDAGAQCYHCYEDNLSKAKGRSSSDVKNSVIEHLRSLMEGSTPKERGQQARSTALCKGSKDNWPTTGCAHNEQCSTIFAKGSKSGDPVNMNLRGCTKSEPGKGCVDVTKTFNDQGTPIRYSEAIVCVCKGSFCNTISNPGSSASTSSPSWMIQLFVGAALGVGGIIATTIHTSFF